ncbi:MAG TPA: cobalamin B12-binding domain-containing protein [Burkholderiaceae bacterium]
MESMPQEYSAREGLPRSAENHDCEVDLPGFVPAEAANDVRMSQLARTIEEEIIPRLMLAHRTATEPVLRPGADAHRITEAEIVQFAKLVLSHEEDMAFVAIEGLRARGVSVEKLFVDLLAPTARYLGHLWNEDLCNFTDVTVGLGRLQRVLRELSPALGRSVEHPSLGRRVLLLPSPGEQHTFGLVMVSEFFRRAGWDVSGGAWTNGVEAASLVTGEWFDVVGFSLGAAVHLQELTASIAAVRHAACNQDLLILVGGPLFAVHPEYVAQVNADGMTIDGREAPSLAESLIARKTRQHGSPG